MMRLRLEESQCANPAKPRKADRQQLPAEANAASEKLDHSEV